MPGGAATRWRTPPRATRRTRGLGRPSPRSSSSHFRGPGRGPDGESFGARARDCAARRPSRRRRRIVVALGRRGAPVRLAARRSPGGTAGERTRRGGPGPRRAVAQFVRAARSDHHHRRRAQVESRWRHAQPSGGPRRPGADGRDRAPVRVSDRHRRGPIRVRPPSGADRSSGRGASRRTRRSARRWHGDLDAGRAVGMDRRAPATNATRHTDHLRGAIGRRGYPPGSPLVVPPGAAPTGTPEGGAPACGWRAFHGTIAAMRRMVLHVLGSVFFFAGGGCASGSSDNGGATALPEDDVIAPGTKIGQRAPLPFERIGELIEQGQFPEALAQADAELENRPQAAQIHFVRGMALVGLARTDEAIAAYERAYELDPIKLYAALDAIGTVHLERGDVDTAIDYYRRCVAAQDDFAAGHVNLGMALLRAGDPSAAYAQLERAATLNPQDADVWLELAVLDQARGDMGAAREKVDRAVAADPNHGFARMVKGDLLVASGDLSAAIAHYEEAVKVEPDLHDARMKLIRVLRKSERAGEAEAHVETLTQRAPQSAVAWSIHAQIRFEQGRTDEAFADLERALSINPGLVSAHRRKIRFLIAQKRCEEAQEALADLERHSSDRPAATQATAEVRDCRA
ncbi:MAG: tetratricopeptide repeat protein [Myxococcales bacterium FL481]|nr:MAG: tetratricopeptide repeat protein [Myxococcales bacterium FL481]